MVHLIFLPLSVAVEEAYEAQQRGDQKREFDVLQAHLEDLSFNKAQVIAELENEEVRTYTYLRFMCVGLFVHRGEGVKGLGSQCSALWSKIHMYSIFPLSCLLQKEKKSPEKELQEEIKKLNDNDDTIIEVTQHNLAFKQLYRCALSSIRDNFSILMHVLVLGPKHFECSEI